jgi:FkbM family methyltransferase
LTVVDNAADWLIETNEFLCAARGVVHIGANAGQECRLYGVMELPALFVEALEGPFKTLVEEVVKYPNQRAFQYLLTDTDGAEYDFGIANNDGQSSSIFQFGDHVKLWPSVKYVDSVKLKSSTFKTMVERERIDLSSYDALVMDVQGAELLVLKGMRDCLDGFRFIRCETADFDVYRGCCQMKDLDEYLSPRGFTRTKTIRGAGYSGLGFTYEALYERVV